MSLKIISLVALVGINKSYLVLTNVPMSWPCDDLDRPLRADLQDDLFSLASSVEGEVVGESVAGPSELETSKRMSDSVMASVILNVSTSSSGSEAFPMVRPLEQITE